MKKIKRFFLVSCCFSVMFIENVLADVQSCESLLGDEVTEMIKDFYFMVGYIVAAVTVILGILDFFKVFTGGDKSELKVVAQKLVKRILALAIFLMLPGLVEWILKIAGIRHGGTCL